SCSLIRSLSLAVLTLYGTCGLFLLAFPFHPHLAVGKDFLFPNRHGAFVFANGPFASFEGAASVRRADADHHARLADFQAAGAVDDANMIDVEFRVSLLAYLSHLAQGHRFVSLVNQVERAAAFGPFARVAIEGYRSATFGQDHAAGDGAHVDRVGCDLEEIEVGSQSTRDACVPRAAADWWKDCEFIAVANLAIRLGIFLVDGEQK